MRSFGRSPLWPWVKVVLVLVALDWVLFDAGLFFRLVPSVQRFPVTWGLAYRCVQELAASPPSPVAYAVGSSIVFLGIDEERVRSDLSDRGMPATFSTLAVFGATGIDQALLAHAAVRNRPWLVVLTGSVRDFPLHGSLDSPVSRVFEDSSVDFPPLVARDVESRLAGVVRRYWGLYRYRFFVRTALQDGATDLLGPLAPGIVAPLPPPGSPPVPSASGAPVPEAASEYFFAGRVSAESWAAWTHWRETRRFADYQEYLRQNRSAAIEQYGKQTFATHGPDGNVQLDALAWAEGELGRAGIRAVVLDFPENPVLQDPEAQALYDTTLSEAVAARLARDARTHGAHFVDLRRLLDPEDFYDLIHPNIVGARKLSDRVGEILAEQWKAAGR